MSIIAARPGLARWIELGTILAALLFRVAVLASAPSGPSGDAEKYIAGADLIMETGHLPFLRVQPHGLSVLLCPLVAACGGRVVEAAVAINAIMDVIVVLILIVIAQRCLSGAARPIRLAFCLACALQPFTGTMVNAVYTEEACMFLTFVGVLAIHYFGSHPSRTIGVIAGLSMLGLAGLLRTDILLLNAALVVAQVLLCGTRLFQARLMSALRRLAVFLVLPVAMLTAQYLSTSEIGFARPEFHCRGYMAWMRTWFAFSPIEYDRLAFGPGNPNWPGFEMTSFPERAFLSRREREQTFNLLGRWKQEGYTEEIDKSFANIASQKSAEAPLRHFVVLPLLRMVHYWVNLDGAQVFLRVFPLPRPGSTAVVGMTLVLRALFLVFAAVGAWAAWCSSGRFVQESPDRDLFRLASLAVLLRTASLGALGTVAWAGLMEIRYVLPVWPFLILLSLAGVCRCTGRTAKGNFPRPRSLRDDNFLPGTGPAQPSGCEAPLTDSDASR